MRGLVVLPGRAPRWVADHGRDIAQRLSASGRVMVAFTHEPPREAPLPGQPGQCSVLGHSAQGYPLWTGRLSAALGIRRRSDSTIIVLWPTASDAIALSAAIVGRLRGERVILDIPEPTKMRTRGIYHRVMRRLLCALAHRAAVGTTDSRTEGATRIVLALCGSDIGFARLAVQTFESMANGAALDWRMKLQFEGNPDNIVSPSCRRHLQVSVVAHQSTEDIRAADVVVAPAGTASEDLVRHAVLSGGAGIIVGPSIAGRVARCHDGVWMATRQSASILVALEASSGAASESPVPVHQLRAWGDSLIEVLDEVEQKRVAAA